MNENEMAQELASAQDLLDSSSFAHLAYIAKDGTPRVIATGFYWTGDQAVSIDPRQRDHRHRRGRRRGVPARIPQVDDRRGRGRVRDERPQDVPTDGTYRAHTHLGALLGLRRRPDAALPRRTRRKSAEMIDTTGPRARRASRQPPTTLDRRSRLDKEIGANHWLPPRTTTSTSPPGMISSLLRPRPPATSHPSPMRPGRMGAPRGVHSTPSAACGARLDHPVR